MIINYFPGIIITNLISNRKKEILGKTVKKMIFNVIISTCCSLTYEHLEILIASF